MLRICANCLAESTSHLRCSRCFNVHYCNANCQKTHWEHHKAIYKRDAEQRKLFEPIVNEDYHTWRRQNNPALGYFARAVGGSEIGPNLVIALLLEYKKENPIESRFQIVSYQKLPAEHQVAQRVISEADEHNPLMRDKVMTNFAVSCPDFGIGNAFRATAIMESEGFESETIQQSAEFVIQAINEGKLAFSSKQQRLSDAAFPWKDMAKYPSPQATISIMDPCAGPGCTKLGPHKCTACRRVSYCSKQCQTAHWPNHKADCKRFVATETRLAEQGRTAEIPVGKVAFNFSLINKEVTEITAKADKVVKSFGLKNINELFTLMAEAKQSGNYTTLTQVLKEKVNRSRWVRLCYELIQLYDFDPSAQMDLHLWGNTHYNQLEMAFRVLLSPQEEMDKFVLYIQHNPHGISDYGRRLRAHLLSIGVDLASLSVDQRPLQIAMAQCKST